MAKISAALRAYRQQLQDMDEKARANMTTAESEAFEGFGPGMTKKDIADAVEQSIATKNEAEAADMLKGQKQLSSQAEKAQDAKELRELFEYRKQKDLERDARIEKAVVRNSVLSTRGDWMLPVPEELASADEMGRRPYGLDPRGLTDEDLAYLGVSRRNK